VGFGALALAMGGSSVAYAVDNGRIQVTVPSIGQTSLKLFDAGGIQVPSGPDATTFTDLKPGAYTLRAERDGKASETKVPVEEDKTCMVKVDEKGDSKLVRCVAMALVAQQQQSPWTFGVLGGWKQTPFDTRLNTSFGNGSADLEEEGTSLALEARYNFRQRQQQLGARMFLYGTYVHYFGTDLERLFLNVHPTPAQDTGVSTEEKNALHLGVGSRWNLAQRLGLELMLGAHATRVKGGITTLESQGGGTDLRFQRTKTLYGPMLALGLTYPLWTMQNGHPLNGVFRWTRTWMPDFSVTGSSAFSGGTYDARVNGGPNDSIQLGVQWDW
jgi:hypothetical protein